MSEINYRQLSAVAGQYIPSKNINDNLLPKLDDTASQLGIELSILEACIRLAEPVGLTSDTYRYLMSENQIPLIFMPSDQSLEAITGVYGREGFEEIQRRAEGHDLSGEELAKMGISISVSEVDDSIMWGLVGVLKKIFPDRYVALYNRQIIAVAKTLDTIHDLIPHGPSYILLNRGKSVEFPILLHGS